MATTTPRNDPLILRALRGEATERTPVWLMRQAGRSDPEYRAYREHHPLPLEDLFRSVEHAVEISLLPKRIGVDAVIFFQDILTPLAPMGAPFVFRPGPHLDRPVDSPSEVARLKRCEPERDLAFVGETLRELRSRLNGETGLLGFAGAPLTLLFFLVAGKSPGKGEEAKAFLHEEPALAHALLDRLADMTAEYLDYQIASGAQAVQLFESIADLLTEEEYREFALPSQVRVFEAMKSKAPKILFAKGFPNARLMKESKADALSVSSDRSISGIREELGPEVVLQGNVSNRLLVEGPVERIQTEAEACIESGGHRGHVLNLDHGILPETPWEHVRAFVEAARNSRPAES